MLLKVSPCMLSTPQFYCGIIVLGKVAERDGVHVVGFLRCAVPHVCCILLH